MKLIQIIKNQFSDFLFFYRYLGFKIFINLFFSIISSLFDGLGLALFIPLLQLVDNSEQQYASSDGNAGNMDYFIQVLEIFGLSMNLTTVLLLIVIFFSLKGLFRFFSNYYSVNLAVTFIKKVQTDSVASISNVNYKHFVTLDSGKIQNSLTSEISRIYLAFQYYSSAIQSLITVFVYVGLAFLTNPQFALFVFIGGALSNFVYQKLYKKTKAVSKNITLGFHTYHAFIIQKISNFKYLRSTGQIFNYNKKIKKIIHDLGEENKLIGFYNSILVATKEPLSILVVVSVILIQVVFFETSLGPIILSLLFFYRSLNQIILFQNHWNSFLTYSGSLVSFKEFSDEINSNNINYEKGFNIDLINEVELKNISFFFGTKEVLKNINLKIEKLQTIALVGSSGSGKTTLSNILTGLLETDAGSVLINSIEIKKLNLVNFQSKIGYISQEPVIFNDSLFNNVTFWDEKNEKSLLKFHECLRNASLVDFFNGLENREDSRLGSNGVMISGGQKQRIAIAREFYRSVDLLILDEATSALDSGTEKEIQQYLDELKGKVTMVVIAHRLSTIKNADVIYMLNNGEIEDSGDFYTLKKNSFEFRKMVELQEFNIDE